MEIGMEYYTLKEDMGKYRAGQIVALSEVIFDDQKNIIGYRFYEAGNINNAKDPIGYVEIAKEIPKEQNMEKYSSVSV